MRYYLYASGGLLVGAVVVSTLLDNWTVLTGVAIGLGMFLGGLLFEYWFDDRMAGYNEETERAREALIGPKPSHTTYYYDDEGDDEKVEDPDVRTPE